MRRIQYHTYGGPETMRLEEFELPQLKAGEVAVTVAAAAVNPIDWKLRQGALKIVTGRSFPRAMGSDFVGVVHAVGPNVTQFRPGDHVFGMARLKESGAFAEVVVTKESMVTLRPAELSVEQAACLPTSAVMAWNGLIERTQLKLGQRVFIGGCTGGVGEAAVQIARMLGARVSGSCGAASMSQARELGVETVYDYATFDDANRSGLRGTFDVVFDTSGGLPVKTAMSLLTKTGVFLDINATPAKFLHCALSRRHKIFNCTPTTESLNDIAQAASAGKLRISIGETTTLDTATKVIGELENGRKIGGKALIVVNWTPTHGEGICT